MKNSIKKYIPAVLIKRAERYLIWKETCANKGKSSSEIFEKIYSKNAWGGKIGQVYCSGSGSHLEEIIEPYISSVSNWLVSQGSKFDVVDLGCGDFNIGSKIRPYVGKYIACDVCKPLIDEISGRYRDFNVDFKWLDIVNDDLPQGELVFLRQVMQHLSNSEVNKILAKLHAKYNYLILTEQIPIGDYVPNLDIATGAHTRNNFNSGIDIEEHPFSFNFLEKQVLCKVECDYGFVITTMYKLNA